MSKKSRKLKRFLGLVLLLCTTSGLPSKLGADPEHAPGELIVQLKEGFGLADIEGLNRQLGVTRVTELFPKQPSPQETLSALQKRRAQMAGAGHQRWYWWADRDSEEAQEYQARIEQEKEQLDHQIKAQEKLMARLERRQQRAPEEGAPPALDKTYLIQIAEKTDLATALFAYQANPAVEYAEPNNRMKLQLSTGPLPNDTYVDPDQDGVWASGSWGQSFEDLWGLNVIQATQAWNVFPGTPSQGEGVLAAVIDSGMDFQHPDIQGNLFVNTAEDLNQNGQPDFLPASEGGDLDGIDNDGNRFVDDLAGYDFVNRASRPTDGLGHGTHVSGTIAAAANNGIGIAGVAPKAKILPVKAFGNDGGGFLSDVAAGFVYAVDQGADVINNSWGCEAPCPSLPTIENAVRYAHQKGVAVVFSAGNNNDDLGHYSPQNMGEEVITVAATNHLGKKSSFSNYGAQVDVSAPGEDILSLLARGSVYATAPGVASWRVGGQYLRLSGTSMAAPHVSGLAALIWSGYPAATLEQVRTRILSTTDRYLVAPPVKLGTGRINAYRALTMNLGPFLQIKGFRLEEAVGDLDQIPESGEEIRLILDLENKGEDASFVGATLSTTSGVIHSLPVSHSEFGSISRGTSKENLDRPLQFKIGWLASAYETPADFIVTTNAEGVIQTFPLKARLGIRKVVTVEKTGFLGSALSISEDKIVWSDRRFGNADLFLYDLQSGHLRQITRDSVDQWYPKISGDRIVWWDLRSGNQDVFLYDLATDEERPITRDPSHQAEAAISEDKIVWTDGRNGSFDITLYDLKTNQERRITADHNQQGLPDISGDRIVWMDDRNGNSDIYLYDLQTGREQPITRHPAHQWSPQISGDRVVWMDGRSGNFDIYLYDGQTGQERRLTTDPGTQASPKISGRWIVWQDDRHLNSDITLYDAQTGQEWPVTTDPASQINPDISGGTIAWYDAGEKAIYIAKAPETHQPPSLYPIGNKVVKEGSPLTFKILAQDPDPEDILSYSASGLPEGATFDRTQGTFHWVPRFDQAGHYSGVRFEVSDGMLSDSEQVTLIVENVNRPPTLAPVFPLSVQVDQKITFQLQGTDPDGDKLSYSLAGVDPSSAPDGIQLDALSGLATWQPQSPGTWLIRFGVTDGEALTTQTALFTARARRPGGGSLRFGGLYNLLQRMSQLLAYFRRGINR